MRLQLVCCVLVLILTSALAEVEINEESISNRTMEEEEYEDIAVAETQDIAHSHLNLSSDDEHVPDRPRYRPRGRKRRRRMRKRPRSTTPSFIEEYDPETSVREIEKSTPLEDEEVYPRRRPTKRRRRPMVRHPEYDINNPEPEVTSESYDEGPYQENHRPRNPQRRRRRKGGRKRQRTTTEPGVNFNYTHEVTTQSTEVVMQSNDFSSHEQDTREEVPTSVNNDDITSTLPPLFTTKEITEINHKLESLSKYEKIPDQDPDYQVSGLGAFSFFQPTSSESTTQQFEDNNVIISSTTPKQYAWITRFEPKATTPNTPEKFHTQESRLHNVESEKIVKQETNHNIKNIEKIIENRKNLFSKSRRLPLTSALIRRRLHPKKYQISTTQETIIDNTIPTINISHFKIERKTCNSVECALNYTSDVPKNIAPNALLPSGFPTMPEILSTAELIKKISSQIERKDDKNITTKTGSKDNEINGNDSSNVIVITPSTLVRFKDNENNRLLNSQNNVIINGASTLSEVSTIPTKLEVNEDYQTSTSTEATEITENTNKLVSTEVESATTPSTMTTIQHSPTTIKSVLTVEPDKFKLDDVDTSNINDEILELIMDDMGKSRVKRILELRNMTLSELIAHRERGAGRFSVFPEENNSKSNTNDTPSMERKISLEERNSDDEEQTEKMIVEKAKHILSGFKRNDEVKSSIKKTRKGFFLDSDQNTKVEGTVIPVPIFESTHSSSIQFPDERVLGAFPKYMYDIAGSNDKVSKDKSVFTESINKPRNIQQSNIHREPRVFESMPQFSSEASNRANLEISPYPDWRITVTKTSTEREIGFPGTSKEIKIAASTTKKSTDLDDVFLLDEGDEFHHLRSHILGRNINIESQDATSDDYPEERRVPAGVKSAIAASGALLVLAIFGFLAVLVSCKIRQRRARLRVRRDILNEHLADDFRGSQRSLTPVLRKSQFNTGIHSNIASNRHYYLWRTLRKTFQYE